MAVCDRCKQDKGFLATLTADLSTGKYICPACHDILSAEQNAASIAKAKEANRIRELAKTVIVTTTPGIDGYYVKRYIGVESVEYVIGTGIFSEITTSFQDVIGSRSTTFENKLQTAKTQAMFALKMLAAENGANAVVGIDLDYTEFSNNRIALIINGTLVEIALRPPANYPAKK